VWGDRKAPPTDQRPRLSRRNAARFDDAAPRLGPRRKSTAHPDRRGECAPARRDSQAPCASARSLSVAPILHRRSPAQAPVATQPCFQSFISQIKSEAPYNGAQKIGIPSKQALSRNRCTSLDKEPSRITATSDHDSLERSLFDPLLLTDAPSAPS